jgi:hypothetical protein
MRQEEPKYQPKATTDRYKELIEAAEGSPGEWFAEDYEAGAITARATIYTHFGKKLVEVRMKGDNTVYLRVK